MLKIESAKVIVSSPGRNFVTLKIETRDGPYGVGDATLNGRELAVASYLEDHLVPCLIGRDAHRIEDIWQFSYREAYWRRGPVTMSAIAAVDMALSAGESARARPSDDELVRLLRIWKGPANVRMRFHHRTHVGAVNFLVHWMLQAFSMNVVENTVRRQPNWFEETLTANNDLGIIQP